jgi:hypothetical protein
MTRLDKVSFIWRPSKAVGLLPINPGRRCACPGLLSSAPPARFFLLTMPRFNSALDPEGHRTVAGGKRSAAPGQAMTHEEPQMGRQKIILISSQCMALRSPYQLPNQATCATVA